MWKNIKKFFKWIADHTGISWIARKISSGWKWLFGGKASATQQNTSQQEKPSGNERQEPAQAQSKGTTTPKTLKILYPKCYFEANNGVLLFIITNENYKVLEAKCKNEDQEGKVIPGEFLVFVKCIDENFCITGSYDSQQDVSNGKKSVSITSIKKQNAQNLVSSNPSMMYQVGLDENRKFVEISRMSRKPFKAPTLEQPKPNVTSHNVTQQVVSNNGAVVLYQMLHDQGRLYPSPELYDYLLRASLVKEMLFCKVAPNSSFTQPIAEQAAGNDHSR